MELSFTNAKGRKGIYVDVNNIFPVDRRGVNKVVPYPLPQDNETLVRRVAELAEDYVVLFWGKSSVYSQCSDWPCADKLILVADRIRGNAEAFLAELLVADHGFYFLEADNNRDLEYMRGWDFRNNTPKGITLVLAATFENESAYIQAKGRVLRGSDEGAVYTLPRKMWSE